jgi:hypothetical protein
LTRMSHIVPHAAQVRIPVNGKPICSRQPASTPRREI